MKWRSCDLVKKSKWERKCIHPDTVTQITPTKCSVPCPERKHCSTDTRGYFYF